MAKRNGATNGTAPATSAPGKPSGIAKALADRALDMGKQQEPGVIEWDVGNGQSTFQAGELPPDVAAAEDKGEEAAEAAPAATTENAGQQAASSEENQEDGAAEAGTVSPPAGTPPAAAKPKGAGARASTFAALEAEQRRVALENQARANAQRAEAAEAELARVKKLPLKERLKWIEANKEELEEALLVDGDDVAELPEKKPAAPDPELAELRETVKVLKERDAAREQTSAQQVISQAHQTVEKALKEVTTVPMVKGVRDIVIDGERVVSGIDLTLRTAHQAWLQAGKAGSPRDYIAGAAEVVETYLREKRPDMAAYMVPAPPGAGGGQQPAPAARGNGAPASIGKRTGARPDAAPKELPLDRHQRDQQIKAEFPFLRH